MYGNIIDDWHSRFVQQSGWTKELRSYLFDKIINKSNQLILEVGCGTGVIISDLGLMKSHLHGLDINYKYLNKGLEIEPEIFFTQGDAHNLPYPDNYFDITICHYFLMWVKIPSEVLREMARVTKKGGLVMSLAEPDYGGRIDYPDNLAVLGKWQIESLLKQGADPMFGRKLSGLFHEVGLNSVQTGILGGQWLGEPDWEFWESEWQVMVSDFENNPLISDHNISELRSKDRSAYIEGKRVLFVPTFYASGIV
jgi:ubiquinone/menaquinone biosynthesis C-methylase UbiE